MKFSWKTHLRMLGSGNEKRPSPISGTAPGSGTVDMTGVSSGTGSAACGGGGGGGSGCACGCGAPVGGGGGAAEGGPPPLPGRALYGGG